MKNYLFVVYRHIKSLAANNINFSDKPYIIILTMVTKQGSGATVTSHLMDNNDLETEFFKDKTQSNCPDQLRSYFAKPMLVNP